MGPSCGPGWVQGELTYSETVIHLDLSSRVMYYHLGSVTEHYPGNHFSGPFTPVPSFSLMVTFIFSFKCH